jgi:membrane protein DedA with SNARE-associated domain
MDLMKTHGQLFVFIGVIIEQIIVPIPSPLIVMGAGAILVSPELSIPNAFLQILWIIVIPGAISSTLGSYIGYLISFYGGKALVVRFQHFLSRAIPVFPISLVSIFVGLLRIPVKPFTLYTLLGSIFRCLFLGFLDGGSEPLMKKLLPI